MTIALKPYPCKLEVKFDASKIPEGCGGICVKEDSKIRVFLDDADYKQYYIHEAVHAVTFLEEILETDFDDETRAYLTLHICDKIDLYASRCK